MNKHTVYIQNNTQTHSETSLETCHETLDVKNIVKHISKRQFQFPFQTVIPLKTKISKATSR